MLAPALVSALLAVGSAATGSSTTPRTFRVDYFHTGDASTEIFSLDRSVVEPLPWPGNPAKPIDDLNLGKYLFEVRDRATNRLLYSRGFSSVFGEWETTAEAKGVKRTFSESFRFPMPTSEVQIILKKRDTQNVFREVWSVVVDPKDQMVDTSAPPSPGPLIELQKMGPPAEKVDLLILGDGYTAAERGKFEKDAKRLVDLLFSFSPFKERRRDFNVYGLCPPSPESGISRPSLGIHHRSPVGATYDAFGSERYILTFENRKLRDVASFAPYEFIEVLANGKTYGGGGIFNLYSTVAADSLWSPYVFVHELGHHFAALADEYYTSDTSYEAQPQRIEPWEPNVTAFLDPDKLKWQALVTPGTPVPTPWRKEEFEAQSLATQKERHKIRAEKKPESVMDQLFLAEQKRETQLLGTDTYSGKVGAFEGAGYEPKGFFRPQEDCVMFSRDQVPFCRVCQHAIIQVIDLYSRTH